MAGVAITPSMMTPGNPAFLGLPMGTRPPVPPGRPKGPIGVQPYNTTSYSPGSPGSPSEPGSLIYTGVGGGGTPSGGGGGGGGVGQPQPKSGSTFGAGPFSPANLFMTPQGGNTSGMQGQDVLSADLEKMNQANLIGESSGITGFLSGNPQDSPLYKSLLSSSRSAIGNSYDAAVANTRASAASRGFGYESPSEGGEEAGLRGQEAGAFSAAPSQALQQTIAPELQAAGILTNQAGMYANQATAEEQMATALEQARMGKSAAMFGDITQLLAALSRSGPNVSINGGGGTDSGGGGGGFYIGG